MHLYGPDRISGVGAVHGGVGARHHAHGARRPDHRRTCGQSEAPLLGCTGTAGEELRGGGDILTVDVEPGRVARVPEAVVRLARVAPTVGGVDRADVECGHDVAVRRYLLADEVTARGAEALYGLAIEQPGEARRRRPGGGAAQRDGAPSAQRLLDERVVQLGRRVCNAPFAVYSSLSRSVFVLNASFANTITSIHINII